MTPSNFSSLVYSTFTILSSDGETEIELIEGGADREVTWETRQEYARLSMEYRLHEFDVQLAEIARGE